MLAAAAVIGWLRLPHSTQLRNVEINVGSKPLTNPLKGFMAWGENHTSDPLIRLAYIPVYWDELEPEEGVYDFAALEERCNFAQWREDKVHLVLRLVLDTPADEAHMDIPQWLYDKMGGAGTWYDCGYGKGFSPDYTNETLIREHRELIQELGKRYSQDPQLAYVELGSLGHWGEWHVNQSAGIPQFPPQEICEAYVEPYVKAFGGSRLLLRRPVSIGVTGGMGLYNDSFGLKESHEFWLDWIQNGYMSDQSGETLPGMPDFWKTAPSGGEISPSKEMNWYFSSEQYPVTLDLMKRSHTTFLGPNSPKTGELSGTERENMEAFLAEMGYCLGIRSARMVRELFTGELTLSMDWENTGVAPLYAQWPLRIELRGEDGKTVWTQQLVHNFQTWDTGIHSLTVPLQGTGKMDSGHYTVYVGIVDPLTGMPEVALEMDTVEDHGMYFLMDISL